MKRSKKKICKSSFVNGEYNVFHMYTFAFVAGKKFRGKDLYLESRSGDLE